MKRTPEQQSRVYAKVESLLERLGKLADVVSKASHTCQRVAMQDETGEREDAITVDEQGCVVNTDWRSEPSKDEQRAAREREMYEAWRKKAEGKR